MTDAFTMQDAVYRPAQVRELDRIAIEEQGIPGFELMSRAAQFAFSAARERFPAAGSWQIWCGGGNNAGDGYVIATLALQAGLRAELVALADPAKLRGDAATAYAGFTAAGGEVVNSPSADTRPDLIVDALLGTGLERDLEGRYAAAVAQINATGVPVLAVDIPTGISGASGEVMGCAIQAAMTATFVGLKTWLFLAAGPVHGGEVLYSDLGIAPVPAARVPPVWRVAGRGLVRGLLPPRPRDANKGRFGHVLVAGGNAGMGGAARLAAEAALRGGAGLVSVATRPANVPAIVAGRPEVMCRGVESAADLDGLLARASVIAIGPGLGQDDWARHLFDRVLQTELPLVVDADALNLLAAAPGKRDNWVLTPHPGEAARLLGTQTAAVQADRDGAVRELQRRYGGVALLKGAGTLIAGGSDRPWLVRAGNPGMATGGMGDVLTGVVAGVLAQCPDADPATVTAAAAWAHAAAGDRAAWDGERGLLAGDVLAELRACLN